MSIRQSGSHAISCSQDLQYHISGPLLFVVFSAFYTHRAILLNVSGLCKDEIILKVVLSVVE